MCYHLLTNHICAPPHKTSHMGMQMGGRSARTHSPDFVLMLYCEEVGNENHVFVKHSGGATAFFVRRADRFWFENSGFPGFQFEPDKNLKSLKYILRLVGKPSDKNPICLNYLICFFLVLPQDDEANSITFCM